MGVFSGFWTGVKKFLYTGESFSVTNRMIVGSLAPFIGNDDKTTYIKDYEQVKYVYAVISWLAMKCARTPIRLFSGEGDNKQWVQVNRFLDILKRPNSYQSKYQFLFQAYGYLFSTGALYIYIPKLSSGRWTEMHVLSSNFVEPVYEREFEGPVKFYMTESGRTVSKDEMIFINFPSLDFDQLGVGENGTSPMKSLRTVTQKSKDIDKADLATIQNGGVAGIITDKTAEEGLTPSQRERVEKDLADRAYGPGNRGRWYVTSGDVSFIPIGSSPVDLNLHQANRQTLEDICIVYHIPYILFMQTETNASFGTAMKEAKKQAYFDAIFPAVEMVLGGFTRFGLDGFGRNLSLEIHEEGIKEIQTDAKLLADTLSVQWWKTIGQKQKESGMEPDPKMSDVYLIPSNLVRLEEFTLDLMEKRYKEESDEIGKLFE
jgi:HK97 family phage portal protein